MKLRLFITTILLFFAFTLLAQRVGRITVGAKEQIHSEILNEDREVWVHVPEGMDNASNETVYPVVYLLDGDSYFYSLLGTMHHLSSVNGNTYSPKMIIVGILNTNRNRDLTPTKPEKEHPFASAELVKKSGGGEDFMSFIETELMPYIDNKYPTAPYRLLVGHSFGGLTVMNTFLSRPYLFQSYISIDPSMWWDDQKLNGYLKAATFDENYAGKSLYIGIANSTDDETKTLSEAAKDNTTSTEHIRSIITLDQTLQSKSSNFNYKSQYYVADSHGSVPMIATYDALRFIFGFYHLKLENDDFINPETDIVAKMIKHYKNVSAQLGFKNKPSENMINELGNYFLTAQQYKKARQFFIYNASNYPNSWQTYDALGDYYKKVGKQEFAAESYEKALLLKKNQILNKN